MNDATDPLFPAWNNLLPLAPGEVRVFGLKVGDAPGLVTRAGLLLSQAERERAVQIRATAARGEFVVGRAALRFLTGAILGQAPAEVGVETGAFGKPVVRGVHSNVTHSRGLIYVALCRDRCVGIDVEWIDVSIEAMELAEEHFSQAEVTLMAAQPEGMNRARVFCDIWTRKEAVAKACGLGLRVSLQKIVVPRSVPGLAWIEHDVRGDASAPAQYQTFYVRSLSAPNGFALSLAVEGDTAPQISCRDFHE